MKRIVSFIVFCLFTATFAFAQQNLLSNPGFEEGTDSWVRFDESATDPVIEAVESPVKSGSKSLKLTSTNSRGVVTLIQYIPVTVGKQYDLSVWYNVQSVGEDPRCKVYLRYAFADADGASAFDGGGGDGAIECEFTAETLNSWQQVTLQTTEALEGTAYIIITLNTVRTITACFDDASVTEVGGAVAKQSQTISGLADISKTVGDAPFELTATASSGLTVSYAISDESVATVSGNVVTIVGAGTATITASQAGDDSYEAAEPVTATLTVGKMDQTISGLADISKTVGDAPFELTATASSGLTVSYAISDESVATVSGNVVTIVGSGTATITASQSGNDTYHAATPVTVNLTVGEASKQDQTITGLDAEISKTVGDAPFELTAAASSGLTVSYAISDESVATVSGNVVTIVGSGTATITASQSGNDTYNAATPVTATLTVGSGAGIEGITAAPLIRVEGGRLIVKAVAGSPVEVYSAQGVKLHSSISHGASTVIDGLPKGSTVIVRNGKSVSKAVL